MRRPIHFLTLSLILLLLPLRGDVTGPVVSGVVREVIGPVTGNAIISAPTPDFYADSVNGSDANDGLTEATAFQTLGALETAALAYGDGVTLGLARGSYWEEFLDLDSLTGAGVMAYGTGDPPAISGAIPVTSGSFTLSAHGDAGGVVYEFSWTRGDGDTGGQDLLMVWEGDYAQSESGGDGSGTPSQNRLVRTTSVALCAGTAGTYYAPGENSASSTVYVHPYGSTNPTSDSKVYYVTKHSAGIDNYSTSLSAGSISGLHLRRSWGHYGPLQWGDSPLIEKIIIEGGGLHHTVNAAASVTDMVLLDHPKSYGQSNAAYTGYIPDGLGKDHSVARLFVVGDSIANQNISAGLSHGSSNPFDNVTYSQVAAVTTASGFSAAAGNGMVISGLYSNNVTGTTASMNAGTTSVIEYSVFRGGVNSQIVDAGPVDTTVRDRILRHSVIYFADAGGQTRANITPRNGSVLVEYCVIVVDSCAGTNIVAATDLDITWRNNIFLVTGNPALAQPFKLDVGAGTLAMDHNLYVRQSTSSLNGYRFEDGAGYVQNLAAWVTRSAQDQNSLYLNNTHSTTLVEDIFLNGAAGLALGDFRINPSSGYTFVDGSNINTAGPQYHWDWNARAVAAGPPTAWPDVPETLAESKTYIADPEAWDFYP